MLIICVVWGFTFVAGKAGVSEMPPMLFTALRYMLLALLLFPFLRIVPGKMPQVMFITITGDVVVFVQLLPFPRKRLCKSVRISPVFS